MTFEEDLKNQIAAGVSAIYVETTEWERFETVVERASAEKSVRYWNRLTGLYEIVNSGEGLARVRDVCSEDLTDFEDLIKEIEKMEDENFWDITVIEHADRYFNDLDLSIMFAILLRNMKRGHQIIVVAPTLYLPDVLKSEFSVMSFPLPNRDDIKTILSGIKDTLNRTAEPEVEDSRVGVGASTEKKKNKNDDISIDTADEILDSVRGLGTTEIRNAFLKVAREYSRITAEEIEHLVAEKEQIIRKSGYLEFIKTNVQLSDIGGLGNLKEWLKGRKVAFGSKARKSKLKAPKGVLLLGIPGTGKSLSAKAVASIWEMPLLRLDMARIFGGLVGESESNMRNTIRVAESMAPCILWIDEIEKGLSGGQGGERDGGTSARVFGTFLTWMQEKEKEVFIFATANDVSKLPPEFLRKGRFDEVFFVDLPDRETREKIFKIHLRSINQGEYLVTNELLEKTEAYSGAEIESIVDEAHFTAHGSSNGVKKKPEIMVQYLCDAVDLVVPLAHTMREEIEKMRKWSEGRCRKAGEGAPPRISIERDVPTSRKEHNSPFMSDENRGENQ